MIRLKKRIIKNKNSLLLIFVNRFMRAGKRDFIYKNFIYVLICLKRTRKITFNRILRRILSRISPVVQLKPKFVSGIVYLLPSFIKPYKSQVIGLSWLIKAVKARRDDTFYVRLLTEFVQILQGRGFTLNYKQEYYKLVLQNRVLLFKFRNR